MTHLALSVRPILSAFSDPVYFIDTEWTIASANQLARLTFPGIIDGMHLKDLGKTIGWQEATEIGIRCLARNKRDFKVVREESGRVQFEITCVPLVPDDEGPPEGLLVSVVNVLGETLRDERFQILSRAFDSISEGVLALDGEGKVTGMNRSAASLLGVREEEVNRVPLREIVRLQEGGQGDKLWRALENRCRMELQEELILPSGRAIPCSLSLSPIEEAGSFFSGFVVILKDRTAQVALERNLLQIEKLNALGKLVAGFAHELNNPLASVIGFSQLLLRGSEHEDVRLEVQAIYHHAIRCKEIVDKLLAFARMKKLNPQSVDVNQVVRETLDLVGFPLKGREIKIRVELYPGVLPIKADPYQLQQVLVNIIENGRYALLNQPQSGELRVVTEHRGEWLNIRIQDNGPGIPEALIDQVFDPFFTTKPVGEGTGLGLSLSHGIVQEMGGLLSVENRPQGGVEFRIQLPINDEPADHDKAGE